MGEDTLKHTMYIYIEGPNHLSCDTLEAIVDHYKGAKKHNLALCCQRGLYAAAISNINNIFFYYCVNFVCSVRVFNVRLS